MKVSLFQQAPYRFMPEGFEDARRAVGRVGALRGARRPDTPVRLVPLVRRRDARSAAGGVRRRRGDRARPDVVRHDAEPEPAGGDPRERDPEGAPRSGADRARPLAREDSRAAADRGGVRDARLPLGRAARRRAAGRAQLRREPEQRDPDRRDEGPLPRGARAADPLVDVGPSRSHGTGVTRSTRSSTRGRGRSSSRARRSGSRLRHAGDDDLDARAGLRVRRPELVRGHADRETDLRPLLGAGRPAREAAKPVSGPASSRASSSRRRTSAPSWSTAATSRTTFVRARAACLSTTWASRATSTSGASRRCFAIPAISGSQPS